MSASIRTLIYAGVAVVFAGLAFATHRAMQPADLAGFDLVGEEFYSSFKEPEKAARLRVAAYDSLREKPQVFAVEKHGDTWRIPSHHDYPAEAKTRLAETAASVIGVTRDAVASRRPADHERYGVIDPLDDKSTAIRGRGQRITLFDDQGKELVDMIVGNKVEGESDQYYVRTPDEKETYRAALNVKLSTKFSDWVEPDLLKLSSSDLVALDATRPIVEEEVVETPFGPRSRSVLVGNEELELTRKDSTADWQLAGINPAAEELNSEPVSSAVTALDNLKLIGVRPKPRGINADFTLDFPEEVQRDKRMFQKLFEERRDELGNKGFDILVDKEGRPRLFTLEGDLTAATKEGVVYHLHFGNQFTGSLEEIEFGAAGDKGAKSAAKDEKAAGKTDEPSDSGSKSLTEGDEPQENNEEADAQKGRYVLVSVAFDPKYLGEEPTAPVEPQKPAGEEKPKEPAAEKPAAEKPEGEQPAADNPESKELGAAESEDAEPGKEAPADAGKPPAEEQKSPGEAAYEEALKDYQTQKIKYDSDKQAYDEKLEKGKATVKRLNDRFKGWYYVVSAESFEKLRLTRDAVVTAKEPGEPNPVVAPNPPGAAPEEPEKEGSE